ncbi:ammonium transporter [Aliifodinibius sp. S!AR15-10]|uniref:ammonium transporter n=1 Tax=Aliifodinibius sp. S!AR15-10 TaxID=2950437 RepID=UPI00285C3FBB|nr:ammonium transporter [Aliifodinibius sp. S!AR15-10]MDR8389660.1 ammonium transporter [Aliifodinibius sp. S!AR15-10]
MPKSSKIIILLLLFAGLPGLLLANPADILVQETIEASNDKTFVDLLWIMVAGFLVFFMQAGFALVETGFTRAKNVANIMMKNLMDFGLGTIFFWICGFAIMYGTDMFGLFGTSNFFLSDAITPDGELDAWMYANWFFQAVFAATAATIVSGAVAERTKFTAYIIYTVFITAFIYPVVGHWIWGGGWLADLGFYDFAGSTVVHSVGAWAGLVGTMMLGPRIGRFVNGKPKKIAGHSMALGTLGVFILWLGWFGFNPGSTLGADLSMARIAVTTNLAAAGGAVAAMGVAWLKLGKPDLGYTLNGALAGLVAITAGCAVVSPASALIIGAIGGVIMIYGSSLLEKMKIDDPVGAIPVHGLAGVWGTIAVALFAQAPFSTFSGLFFGGSATQLLVQVLGTIVVFAWTVVTAFLVFKTIEVFHGLRVSPEEELNGLDKYEHGMRAYPDFFGVNDAREMMDLDAEQEMSFINNPILSVDIENTSS